MQIAQQWSKKYIWLLFMGLSILASVSKIFVGFDIDEGYALALPYRLLQGDKLLTDMWEVHQTSSIFAAAILKPFLVISGSAEGIVLYSRVVSTMIHLLISFLCYGTLRLYISKAQAGFMALVYFNFLPKWMMNVDFSMQFVWFFVLCILCILMGEYNRNKKQYKKMYLWIFLAGVSLAFLVLGYPTMVFLYPVYVILLFMRKGWEKGERIKSVLAFTGGCGILAVLFLGYLLSYMSISQLFENIPHVFSDGSHQFSGTSKWSLWIGHGKDVVVQTAITGVPSLLMAGICHALINRNQKNKETGKLPCYSFCVTFTNVYISLTSAIILFADLLGVAWGPFRLQIRYIVMFVLGFFIIQRVQDKKMGKWVLQFCMMTSLVAFLSILLASNVGPTSSSSYLTLGVMAMLWMLMEEIRQIKEGEQSNALSKSGAMYLKLTYMALTLFLLSIIFCKGYYVRVTEYPPSNIRMERMQIAKGAAKGIYVYPSEYEEMTETYEIMTQYSDENDRVLYLGTQALSNLYTEGEMVLPTTISTPAFNEQWVEYFGKHPKKMPTVIFLSKSTVKDQEKFFEKNAFGIWLAKHYDVENRIDTEHLCVIMGEK